MAKARKQFIQTPVARAIALMLFCVPLTWIYMTPSIGFDRVEILPVDEAFKDVTLQDYRNSLLQAVISRDQERVLMLAADDFTLGHGGSGIGQKELIDYLQSDQNWQGIEMALRMGGTLDSAQGSFWAPYIWSGILHAETDIDPFEQYVVIGKSVRVRSRPGLDAAIVAHCSHEIIQRRQSGEHRQGLDWLAVTTPDGYDGWIHKTYVRHALGLRLSIERLAGRWRWSGLYEGD